MLPASCPSLVLIFAFRSMRIAFPPNGHPAAPPSAGRAPARPLSSIRHVHVTASTHAGSLEQRRQSPLLAAQCVEKPKRLLHRQVAAEVGERSLHGRGLPCTRRSHRTRREARGRDAGTG